MSIESQDSEIGPVALELDDGDQRSAIIRLSGEFDTTNCAKIREIFAIALESGAKRCSWTCPRSASSAARPYGSCSRRYG
jgi:hypothetical protein